MLDFKPVSKRDVNLLRRYYEDCDYGLCEYSTGTRLMWRKALNTHWAECGGCLVVRSGSKGKYSFDYPVPGPEGDVDKALEAIEKNAQGLRPVSVMEGLTCLEETGVVALPTLAVEKGELIWTGERIWTESR